MESGQISPKRPGLGSSLLCSQNGSYFIETPYGFQLDLDFLKYVEEIEKGSKVRRAVSRPQQSARPPRLSQRGPRAGNAQKWTSIECLTPGSCEEASKSQLLAPVPLSDGRVERTLAEARHRLQQIQQNCSKGPEEPGGSDSPPVSPGNTSITAFHPLCPSTPPSPAGSLRAGVGLEGVGRLEEGRRSVAVGDDRPLEEGVFYWRTEVQEACVGVEPVETHQVGVGTEAWLESEAELQRELQALRQLVEIQRERIHELEAHLSHAQQEVLRARQEQGKSQMVAASEICPELLMGGAQGQKGSSLPLNRTEGHLNSPRDISTDEVPCSPGRAWSPVVERHDQSTQTDSSRSTNGGALPGLISRGSQWENPDEEGDKSTIPALKNGETTASRPAPCVLKSIMKRGDGSSSSGPSAGRKKCLQFVGIVNGGYDSTSSEEDEEEEEGSWGFGGSDNGEEDTTCEEKNTNADSNSDPDKLKGTDNEEENDKFELSAQMREACLILKSHLDDDLDAQNEDDVLSCSRTVELEWFRVSSSKTAKPAHVTSYMAAFSEVFPGLMECVVNMADVNGNTALHYSISYSNFDVVGLLLDTGWCRVDQQNKAGYSALMLAALASLRAADDMQVVRRLFRLGDINAKASQGGKTALMLAVSQGRMEMVWALLDCGADVNARDTGGSTALMCACEHGRAQIVSLLLQHPCCDITLQDNDGSTALSIALESSRSDITVLLYTHMNRSVAHTPTAVTTNGVPGRPPLPRRPHRRPLAEKTEKLKN